MAVTSARSTTSTPFLHMSSLDLLDISSSNRPCSDSERKEISSILPQLLDLREQLSLHVERNQQIRAETIDKINPCQVALAPHRRVPPEILQEIFFWYCYNGYSVTAAVFEK